LKTGRRQAFFFREAKRAKYCKNSKKLLFRHFCSFLPFSPAQNYSENVGKAEALQVLNYLKRHSAGHLGLIITRNGADDACMATISEH
jgi:hypothetical protein